MEQVFQVEFNRLDRWRSLKELAPVFTSKSENKDFLFEEEDELPEVKTEECFQIETEGSLSEAVWRDDSNQLVSLAKQNCAEAFSGADPICDTIGGHDTLDPGFAARLLQLACKLDSVECARALIEGDTGTLVRINEMDTFGRTPLQSAAEMHSSKCVDLLLRKNARTDIRSKDGNALLALEIALSSKRMLVPWSTNESVEKLLVLLSQRDLSAIRLLAQKTRELAEVAYSNAMEGRVVVLAALLIVAADKVTAPMSVRGEGGSRVKDKRTIYECILGDALLLGEAGKPGNLGGRVVAKRPGESSGSAQSSHDLKKLLLCEIDLLQLFGAVACSKFKERMVMTPLLRASQVGDESIIKVLLKTKTDVNETDTDGNSALHWCLKAASSSSMEDPRIVWLLLKHGARVCKRNRLGLTPVHFAAANGNYQALQILLLEAPECVDIASETKETPLFFAVKNEFIDCAQLLLRYGANSQALNLRRQRPVDVAKSQDMRFMLSPNNTGFWSRTSPPQEASVNRPTKDGFNDDIYEQLREYDSPNTESTPDSGSSNEKTELCRYYESPSGCVRGGMCYFAHGESELRRVNSGSLELKQGTLRYVSKHPIRSKGDLHRKIFIGGLPFAVDSDYLKEFFEAEFGSVEDAVVIATQAGDHVQSRGFGFVTFKQELTVATAVEVHFVTIMGKKAEIKSAIPKIEMLSEASGSPQLVSDDDSVEKNAEPTSWVDKLLSGHRKACPAEHQIIIKSDSMGPTSEKRLPPWVPRFKKWLPVFLEDVSKRLGEGEWYPLSSLKGDFRATCGLELDHTSLGFLKLSDFMRSLPPGICKMRVVPVGRGPATHLVLLPSLFSKSHRHLLPPPTSPQQQQHLSVEDENLSSTDQYLSVAIPDSSDLEPSEPSPIPLASEFSEEAAWFIESLLAEKDYFCHSASGAGESSSGFDAGRDDFIPGYLKPTEILLFNGINPMEKGDFGGGKPFQVPVVGDGCSTGPFSYFQYQWDYHRVQRPFCVICKCQGLGRLLTIIPCLHNVCESCKENRRPRTCVSCRSVVCAFKPWVRPGIYQGNPTPMAPNYPPQASTQRPLYGSKSWTTALRNVTATPDDTAKCQYKFSCDGAKATIVNLPCGHKTICLSCVPHINVHPKSCRTCGHAVGAVERVKKFP